MILTNALPELSIRCSPPDRRQPCSCCRMHTTHCKDRWPKRGVNWAFFLFSKTLMRNLNNLTYIILGAQIHQTLVEEKTSYSRQVTQACKRY
jgi:hypothetical protein